MLTKWKTTDYRPTEIVCVACERETEQTVWVRVNAGGCDKPRWSIQQRRKDSGGDIYHPTWEAAHAHLMARAESMLGGARRGLQVAQSNYGNVKGLRKPVDPFLVSG